MSDSPVLVVHGGAWAIPDEMVEENQRGMRRALQAGWKVLASGGAALDAVEAAVVVLEEDEAFDAGRGSFLNRDGRVQLDAAMMEGAGLRAGAVGCVERIRNPIRLARRILEESPHVYLVAAGAERFAQEHGMTLCQNHELVLEREVERLRTAKAQVKLKTPEEFTGRRSSHDTVGAVARDARGNLAAATSTGGTLNKAPGRVGDSSLIGCGCYADNQSAAVSTTGWGEAIMKLVLAKWAADRVGEAVPPEQAARRAVDLLQARLSGHGGIIVVDRQGRYGLAHNTPRMAWGLRTAHKEACGVDLLGPAR